MRKPLLLQKIYANIGSMPLWSYFLFALLLIITRNIELVLNPRIWAEEGSLYFQNAYNLNSWQDFFSPHLGYYSLLNKIVSYVAIQLPLKAFPWITLFVSIGIYLLFFRITFFSLHFMNRAKIFACFSLIVLASTPEIWLNTLCLQFWLGLISILILLDTSDYTALKWKYYLPSLILASLTGVISMFLWPIYGFRWFIRKDRCSAILLAVLSIGLLVQIVSFVICLYVEQELGGHAQGGTRFSDFSIITMIKGFIGYYVAYPFLSVSLFDFLPKIYALLTVLVCVLLGTVFWINKRDPIVIQMLSIFSLMSFMTIILSIDGSGGLRYAFAPCSVLFICLFWLQEKKETITKAIALVLILCAYAFAVHDIQYKFNKYYSDEWPQWSQQIKETTQTEENGCHILIWPQEPISWSVTLSKCPKQ